MVDQPTDPELAKIKEGGRLIAPFLTVWAATTLAAARMQGDPLCASAERRQQILDDSIKDALHLLRVI